MTSHVNSCLTRFGKIAIQTTARLRTRKPLAYRESTRVPTNLSVSYRYGMLSILNDDDPVRITLRLNGCFIRSEGCVLHCLTDSEYQILSEVVVSSLTGCETSCGRVERMCCTAWKMSTSCSSFRYSST